MKRVANFIALFFAALAAVWSMPDGLLAQTENQAALVIRHGDNDVQTACVDFDEPQITGYELMQLSGFNSEYDIQGMGALVCSIDDTGCPPNDCLCQCKGGGDCVYWSYWHRTNGNWEYSQGGPSVYTVEPGSIEAWSWGPGSPSQAIPPPDLTFEDVCEPEPTNTPTPSPTATSTQPPLLITPDAGETQGSTQATSAPGSTNTPTATSTTQPTAAIVNTTTSTPIPKQPTATALPTNTLLPPTAAAVVTTLVSDSKSTVETAVEAISQPPLTPTEAIVEQAAAEIQPAESEPATSTPAYVAVVQNFEQEPAVATPFPNAQKIAPPTAEPTALLHVIGEGVVPEVNEVSVDEAVAVEHASGFVNAETLPYIVFLSIIVTLAALLGIFSLQKRGSS